MIENTIDKICVKIAWLLPRRLVAHVFARVVAYATSGPWSGQAVPGLLAVDTLKRWIGEASEQRGHMSDCALHNGPAYPPGPCDCGFEEEQER